MSDPYLSIWSEADHLTDGATRHWTGKEHPLVSLIRIDGKPFRLMGVEAPETPALPQIGVARVTPTRSIYEFAGEGVHVTLTFLTPFLPNDLDVLARPVTYLTWEVHSTDGKAHSAALFSSVSSLIGVNFPQQAVDARRETAGTLTALHAGTVAQTLLSPPGDDARIDWGYVYAAAPTAQSVSRIGGSAELANTFTARGTLPAADDTALPRPANENTPVLAFTFDLGQVAASGAPTARHLLVAYDEIYSVQYFSKKLRPYWRRAGGKNPAATLLQAAERDYADLNRRCTAFDDELTADAARVGGPRYARICALAYRQTIAATGIAADAKGKPLLFTKENTSNGDIATVDVFFPSDPLFLLLSPTLAKASAVPVLTYAASNHWTFPNAPHDLGTYPVASGRDDGGEAMPVEESGNMLLLCDAIAQADGSADWLKPWWPQLTQWAQFLEQYGLDPGDQLCTDDFMGHLAHNANLSVKAILALAAYGDLCRMRGDKAGAAKYAQIARQDADHWMKVADGGDVSLLAFDKPGTWSQKYNLVWDRILGLNVFPPTVAAKEIAFYKTQLGRYGVPLDSRTKLGDADHSFFSATLATDQADFETITTPFYDYLTATTSRLPMVDTYYTDNVKSDGMHARSVVGGVFIKMLSDRAVWKKWARADKKKIGGWAPLPPPLQTTALVTTSQITGQPWRWTTTAPVGDNAAWTQPAFDDAAWQQSPGGFGSPDTPAVKIGTPWTTPDLWIRRTVTLPARFNPADLKILAFHDEDLQIYINGVLAANQTGYVNEFYWIDILPEARAQLKPGATVTLSAHCHQTFGGQGVDLGIYAVKEP